MISIDVSKILIPVHDEEEKEEEASSEKITELRPIVHEIYIDKGISEHQPEDSDALKLHNSLQSLREYLEILNKNKNQEEIISKEEEPVEDNELGPHYHMYTSEPPMEMPPEELQKQQNVGENPAKDLYFQPIPISDKIGMAERNSQVGTEGGLQTREVVMLGVSSATLAVLILLTMFCAAAVYHCSKQNRNSDDYSLSSDQRGRFFSSDSSSYTRTEDSSLLWNERMLSEQTGSEMRHESALSFPAYVDEISTFSDESARTTERDRAEQYGLGPYQAAPPSMPPPAEAVPPAQEAPPAPAPAEGAPPAPVPAEEAPPAPAPAPAEEAPPAPAPAEEAPPAPPPEAPPPAEQPPPAE
ncbi:uncharacterized protein LOC143841213 isoform X2 [Paroedura picta]|uniref:uncharacterized protein LOC143841213 isoform X2 n=1 Tax=Paroedura picta TaxID=143630 RepID=UPI004055B92A